MGIKISHTKGESVTTTRLKIFSLSLLVLSLLFFILFFIYWSANDTNGGISYIYKLIISLTTLTIVMVLMHYYHSSHRIYMLFKYAVIISNAILIGFAIHQLNRGYDDLFGEDDDQSAIEYTYASLGVGFAGVGTLLCIIHNFYGMMEIL